MDIKETQEAIIEEFGAFDDWMDKYSYLIELGNDLDNFDEVNRTQQHLIEGCQSKVWLHAQLENRNVVYTADSDAIIVKGIVALLIRVWSGRTPKEIIESDLHFINEIGLKDHLSPTRSNGLLAMVKQMKLYAVAFQAMQK